MHKSVLPLTLIVLLMIASGCAGTEQPSAGSSTETPQAAEQGDESAKTNENNPGELNNLFSQPAPQPQDDEKTKAQSKKALKGLFSEPPPEAQPKPKGENPFKKLFGWGNDKDDKGDGSQANPLVPNPLNPEPKTAANTGVVLPAVTLPEEKKKELYKAMVSDERRAIKEAVSLYPDDVEKQMAEHKKILAGYRKKTLAKFGVDEYVQWRVSEEARKKKWPME